MLSDLRYAFRLLRRRPGFTAGAALTIALAAGGNLAIFSVAYGLLVRPMVVPGADRVVVVQSGDSGFPDAPKAVVSFEQVRDWQLSVPAFERLAAVAAIRFDVTGDAPAERLAGQAVSWNFFETLGVAPAMGRTFAAPDAGSSPCVISYRVWKGRFGGDPQILGREITLRAE